VEATLATRRTVQMTLATQVEGSRAQTEDKARLTAVSPMLCRTGSKAARLIAGRTQ